MPKEVHTVLNFLALK